jgi:hypothetical protein
MPRLELANGAAMPQEELDCLLPRRDFSRRDFVRHCFGSGFAAAALPAIAQTAIRTDSDGLRVGEVGLPWGQFHAARVSRGAAEPAQRASGAGHQ